MKCYIAHHDKCNFAKRSNKIFTHVVAVKYYNKKKWQATNWCGSRQLAEKQMKRLNKQPLEQVVILETTTIESENAMTKPTEEDYQKALFILTNYRHKLEYDEKRFVLEIASCVICDFEPAIVGDLDLIAQKYHIRFPEFDELFRGYKTTA